jgi:AAHS family benzoate transporter-like MFS transporter
MRSININEMIDESKVNRYHALVVFWCSFIIVFDGFDLGVYGSIVPILMKDWSLSPIEAGALASYTLFGMVFGSLFCGPLADKIGRKKVILFCVVFFSVFTVLCGFAQGPTEFGIYRFLTGLGLGGVVPNAVALTTEYAPKKYKNILTTSMFSGYAVGGVLSAALGIVLIPKLGWQSVFFIGALPLLTIPLMIKFLPDSIGFLVAKNEKEKVGKLLTQINPSYLPQKDDHYEMVLPEKTGFTVAQLFKGGRALSTIMFWISSFMCLLMIYGLNTWLPKLMAKAGYELGSSLMFLVVLNLGAIFGCVFGGWSADRWRGKKVLILFFIAAVVSLSLLGFTTTKFVLYLLVAIAGATTIGTQIILYAYVSQFYPIQMRSTGIGWTTGIGRLGAVLGPMMGGVLLTMNLPFKLNFFAFAIPGIICVLAMVFVRERYTSKPVIETYAEKSNLNLDLAE